MGVWTTLVLCATTIVLASAYAWWFDRVNGTDAPNPPAVDAPPIDGAA